MNAAHHRFKQANALSRGRAMHAVASVGAHV
jgi:hypothetical protein